MRVAAASTNYALVLLPLGWHRAPGLVQRHLIGVVRSDVPDIQVVVRQYLGDILFVGWQRAVATHVARCAATHLASKGFAVSPKSVLDAAQGLYRMGRQLGLGNAHIALTAEGLAGIVGKWLFFAIHVQAAGAPPLVASVGWFIVGLWWGVFWLGHGLAQVRAPHCPLHSFRRV